MENEAIKQEQYKGHTIKIYTDPDPIDPRDKGYQDNFGTMVCFHKRYNLGDEGHGINKDDFKSWDELEAHLVKELDAAVVLPLYLYDHSGITMNTKGFHCPWDSGRVGFIFATRKNIRDNFGVKRIWKGTLERAEKLLQGEVEEYDRYLTGQVYGYRIEDADGEDVDSCWGFNSEPDEIVKECQGIIDHRIKADSEDAKKHYPKVEVFVTRHFNFRASIRESILEPTYEVTIGGEEWGKGKGRNHEQEIVQQMNNILAKLNSEFVIHSSAEMLREVKHIMEVGGIQEINIEECKRDDCQADKDYCCDCNEGDLYKSPDQPDPREDR